MSSGGFWSPACNITTQSNLITIGSTAVTGFFAQVNVTAVSDARDKIVEGDVALSLDFVKQLEPKAFYFRETRESDEPHGPLRYGFLAQDVLALEGDNPVIVNTDDEEKLKMTDSYFTPILVNAIKELAAENEALRARLDAANL
jgi:hypothetical protein